MLSPRKLIAFLTLALTFSSTLAFADCESLGSGWVQGASSGGVTVCVPTGDSPNGAISSGEPVLTENGKEYYAPPSGMADKLTVDSTGRIGRTLDEITRITRLDGSVYIYTTSVTFYTEAGAASTAVWDKVKADPTAFPSLSAALTSASSNPLPGTHPVITLNGSNWQIGNLKSSDYVSSIPLGTYYGTPSSGYVFYTKSETGYGSRWADSYYCTLTSNPATPQNVSMSTLASSVASSGASAESEIDNLIAQNPDLFKKSYTPSATEGLTSPPIPTALTPEKIQEIYAGNGAPIGAGSPTIDPVTGTPTLGDPVEVPQSSDSGSGGDPTSDVYGPGYTPGFNNSPYGSDIPGGADFGIRMSQFMTDLRGSSLFSLPTSILGNIPSSGTSAISFDGGQFGQQSFDFSAFSNQLMIIRSVLLLCFSLLSIRIVTLKR
jgi:hypothetical protein